MALLAGDGGREKRVDPGQKAVKQGVILKDWDIKIVILLHALFGAFLGFLIFTFGFGNIKYVFLGRAESAWRGPLGLNLALGIGAVLGLLGWRYRHHEFHGLDAFTDTEANARLFSKRVMVLISCAVATYFTWQLAKSI
ncbi:MAG TPA: hypothetical protein VM735_02435 [Candidatus Kapabacteria bacterium]|nr:hypothetical protein [Candidatus Kapabacteria bacterium]